jgi:hypothetical protein
MLQLYLLKIRYQFNYRILSSVVHTFSIENDAEIFPAHYTCKIADKGFKMVFYDE